MQEMGFYVRVTVPDSMEPAQVQKDIQTSVGFGKPYVSLQYVLPLKEDHVHNDPG